MITIIFCVLGLNTVLGAILPPVWANPKLNPCASQPGGWQLLYWPPDGKCYKIFKLGYPCPVDMELTPSPTKAGDQKLSAECRCPPSKAQSARDGQCYDLYTRGPCEKSFYFGPDTNYNSQNNSNRQWGTCHQVRKCPNPDEISWIKDSACYPKLSKGPCPKGSLLTINADLIPECKCSKSPELENYRHSDGNCYQHFTKGPCQETGELFLPDQTCGCQKLLANFHAESEKCYELGGLEPCSTGENFQIVANRGVCACKPGYIRYRNSTGCYRPFTQGPCLQDEFLVNKTHCIKQPCQRGYLYFASDGKCHRIGTQGSCRSGQIVTFDLETRPSLDGISYNGICSCQKYLHSTNCTETVAKCDKSQEYLSYGNSCYKLHTQGPCPEGAWIVPKRRKKSQIWDEEDDYRGVCECVPNHRRTVRTLNHRNITECTPPTVILAEYLRKSYNPDTI